jgi:hypothetical protein
MSLEDRTNSIPEFSSRSVPRGFAAVAVTPAELSARLRLCVLLRTDPKPPRLVVLRETAEARAVLGCMTDTAGNVHCWIEIWTQNPAAGETLSNAVLDQRWERMIAAMERADPTAVIRTGWETKVAYSTWIDPAAGQPVQPVKEGDNWLLCRDEATLSEAKLPAYGSSSHRYLYLPKQGPRSPLVPISPGAPQGPRTQALNSILGNRPGMIPLNAGGMMFVRTFQLHEQFPLWDAKGDARPQPPPARPAVEKELKDPGFLLTHLIDTCKALSPEQKRGVTDRLAQAGLAQMIVAPASVPAAPPPGGAAGGSARIEAAPATLSDLRARLGVSGNGNLDQGRMVELLGQLAEFANGLDRAAWQTWRRIAPNSPIQCPAVLSATVGKFASGDARCGREKLGDEIGLLQKLTAALIGTHAAVGRITVEHFRSLSPDAITILVPRRMVGWEAACWRQYLELYGSIDAGTIEETIRQKLVEYAEDLIRKR